MDSSPWLQQPCQSIATDIYNHGLRAALPGPAIQRCLRVCSDGIAPENPSDDSNSVRYEPYLEIKGTEKSFDASSSDHQGSFSPRSIRYSLANLDEIIVIGCGKASADMAVAVDKILDSITSVNTDNDHSISSTHPIASSQSCTPLAMPIVTGFVITKFGHSPLPDGNRIKRVKVESDANIDDNHSAQTDHPMPQNGSSGRICEWIRVGNIDVKEASHPIPDESSVRETKAMIEFVKRRIRGDAVCKSTDTSLTSSPTPQDVPPRSVLVLCLISGGGSSLMCLPRALPPTSLPASSLLSPSSSDTTAPPTQLFDSSRNVSLSDLRQMNSLLLACGANINEINAVRRCVDGVKGGGLAEICLDAGKCTSCRQLEEERDENKANHVHPESSEISDTIRSSCKCVNVDVVSLILSDVVGDDPSVIASGPCVLPTHLSQQTSERTCQAHNSTQSFLPVSAYAPLSAWDVIHKYKLTSQMPGSILACVESNANRDSNDMVIGSPSTHLIGNCSDSSSTTNRNHIRSHGRDDSQLIDRMKRGNVVNLLIGTNALALQAAKDYAILKYGINSTVIVTSTLQGDVADVALGIKNGIEWIELMIRRKNQADVDIVGKSTVPVEERICGIADEVCNFFKSVWKQREKQGLVRDGKLTEPLLLLLGGEMTVNITQGLRDTSPVISDSSSSTTTTQSDTTPITIGLGGRNQHFSLLTALRLDELRKNGLFHNSKSSANSGEIQPSSSSTSTVNTRSNDDDQASQVVVLSVGTDGTDGPTDAAGGVITEWTVYRSECRANDDIGDKKRNDEGLRGRARGCVGDQETEVKRPGVDIAEYVRHFDSYNCFTKLIQQDEEWKSGLRATKRGSSEGNGSDTTCEHDNGGRTTVNASSNRSDHGPWGTIEPTAVHVKTGPTGTNVMDIIMIMIMP